MHLRTWREAGPDLAMVTDEKPKHQEGGHTDRWAPGRMALDDMGN